MSFIRYCQNSSAIFETLDPTNLYILERKFKRLRVDVEEELVAEDVDLCDLIFNYTPRYHDTRIDMMYYNRNCTFRLDFRDDLHLYNVRNEYIYKITGRALVQYDNDPIPFHIVLFEEYRIRHENPLEIDWQSIDRSNKRNLSLLHLCIHIEKSRRPAAADAPIVPFDYRLIGENLLKEVTTDMFLATSDRLIPAHTRIIERQSPYFEKYIKSSSPNAPIVIVVKEFSNEMVEALLTYIYTGRLSETPDIMYELMEAAHKFKMDELKKKCLEYWYFNLNCKNARDLHNLGCKINLLELKKSSQLIKKRHCEHDHKEC